MTTRHHSLEEQVYSLLEEKILNGTLKRGEALTEARVCEMTEVSRTPVREAMHRLERDGLLRIEPNRSAVIVGIDKQDLFDIYEVRRRIEGLASRRAALADAPLEKEQLREIVEMQEFFIGKGLGDKLKTLDSEFHDIVYAIGGSRIINETLSRLHRQIGLFRKRSMFAAGRAEVSVQEHRLICDAIVRGDADAAEALTVSHIENAYVNLCKVLEE